MSDITPATSHVSIPSLNTNSPSAMSNITKESKDDVDASLNTNLLRNRPHPSSLTTKDISILPSPSNEPTFQISPLKLPSDV